MQAALSVLVGPLPACMIIIVRDVGLSVQCGGQSGWMCLIELNVEDKGMLRWRVLSISVPIKHRASLRSYKVQISSLSKMGFLCAQ